MNLYIYTYNNYYNRIHKKAGDSIADYEDYLYYGPVTGVYGFTPGDGVNTTQIIGTSVQPYYDGKGDYLIAHEPNSNKIDSRWFIIDHKRTRDGQWHLTLRRDLIADFYADIIDAPMYIEKAILNDNDPLIYNNEQLNLNQIKTSQELLKDSTNCSWLVGYLAPNITEDLDIGASTKIDYDISIDGIQNLSYYKYSNLGDNTGVYANVVSKLFDIKVKHAAGTGDYVDNYRYAIHSPARPTYTSKAATVIKVAELYYGSSGVSGGYGLAEEFKVYENINTVSNIINRVIGDKLITEGNFLNLDGLTIKDTVADKYYKIKLTPGEQVTITKEITATSANDIELVNAILGTPTDMGGNKFYLDKKISRPNNITTFNYPAFYGTIVAQNVKITLVEQTVITSNLKITNSALIPNDASYRLFCMPYNTDGTNFTFKYNNTSYTMKPEVSMSIMNKIISQYSETFLYDAQILPYCPVKEFLNDSNEFDLNNVSSSGGGSLENIKYIIVKDTTNTQIQGFIAFASNVSFTTQINKNISIGNIKISNECDKYRLCSPNFNGAFEFNLAKNGGVNGFKVSCTYKPYQPYIKVAPVFNELYGANFKDPRGLVCGGEFGLPLLSDKWSTYEIQNKNYLNSFNRQIENMETQQEIQRKQEYWSIGAGAFAGAAGGALAGASVGGVPGAVIGGVAGGLTSLAGGLQDVYYNDKLRTEAIDYTKDQFNYSLQNIQALPYTLARVSSLTNDNTIFPILEYYTCTTREKEALANKIAYNGMTVMAIGKIKDYKDNSWSYGTVVSKGYIKGKLIRLDNLNEDFHMINAIGEELNKGVYMQ